MGGAITLQWFSILTARDEGQRRDYAALAQKHQGHRLPYSNDHGKMLGYCRIRMDRDELMALLPVSLRCPVYVRFDQS
jgi:hypothetical protein